jgi:hypothetical protein
LSALFRSAREAKTAGVRPNEHREERDGGREQHDRCVEARVLEPRNGELLDRGEQRVHTGIRHQQSGGAAERSQQQVLDQQLAHDPAAARAERGAHGQLALPVGGAGEQETADVGARDEQDEPDRPPEHRER